MRLAGFQPLSLLDFPGRPCAILFTQGCPFRCAYCHNPELIPPETSRPPVPEAAIIERLRRHRHVVDAVCVTGGEPTVQPDLIPFLRTLKAEGFGVKLDTNGAHPRVVEAVLQEGLAQYLAMDLKNVWERYAQVTRVDVPQVIDNCRKSFGLIQDSGVDHEFRTTIMPGIHTLADFGMMAGYLKAGETYAVQSFRPGTTLDPSLTRAELNAPTVVEHLRPLFPDLILQAR